MVKKGLLERLDDGVVLGDGGYLLELEKRGYVQAGPFTPEVSLTHPDALAELHREFLLAGAEVLQAPVTLVSPGLTTPPIPPQPIMYAGFSRDSSKCRWRSESTS
jgi:hypothetical protein